MALDSRSDGLLGIGSLHFRGRVHDIRGVMRVQNESIDAPGSANEVDRICTAVRTWITHGRLAPGCPISQVKIANELGVSRGPLREALRLLEREGFVVQEFNHRARVASVTTSDVDQLYAMRIALESLAVNMSVSRHSDAELADTANLLDQMAHYGATQDVDGWDKPHREFHARLTAPAGPRFARDLNAMCDHAERYRRLAIAEEPMIWKRGAIEHAAILAAVRDRNAALASRLTAEHFARTALILTASMDPAFEAIGVRRALHMVRAESDSTGDI